MSMKFMIEQLRQWAADKGGWCLSDAYLDTHTRQMLEEHGLAYYPTQDVQKAA